MSPTLEAAYQRAMPPTLPPPLASQSCAFSFFLHTSLLAHNFGIISASRVPFNDKFSQLKIIGYQKNVTKNSKEEIPYLEAGSHQVGKEISRLLTEPESLWPCSREAATGL
jgi:hypothetical protein